MINNRQGGRRRGRGGQGSGRNLGGQPGNRQDNRQRGNAAQLLEKYKSMARDSQLAGDRVQTEYYLQFADHYFRVLSESRARFEEQNPRRQNDDDGDDDEDGDDHYAEADTEGEGRSDREERSERKPRQERQDRPERGERFSRPRPSRNGEASEERAPHGDSEPAQLNGGETIPFDALPPAIGRGEVSGEPAEAEAPRPRRRSRPARPAGNDEKIAPAV